MKKNITEKIHHNKLLVVHDIWTQSYQLLCLQPLQLHSFFCCQHKSKIKLLVEEPFVGETLKTMYLANDHQLAVRFE